jgi:hypothetical protein
VSEFNGISTVMFFRLWTFAPLTMMASLVSALNGLDLPVGEVQILCGGKGPVNRQWIVDMGGLY